MIDPLLHIGATLLATTSEENMLRGYAFGRLAIRIIETHPVSSEVACPVYNLFASHILIWHRPLVDTQRYFVAAIAKGLEAYDITCTSVAVINRAALSFFAGESLDLVEAKLEDAEPIIKEGNQEIGIHWLSMPRKLVQTLRDVDADDVMNVVFTNDLKDALLKLQINQSDTHMFTYHCYQLVSALIMSPD